MKIYRPQDKITDRIQPNFFLAGPSLRNAESTPWRDDAVEFFKKYNFPGSLSIPEPFNGDYADQIKWEEEHLANCTRIIFWIPRDMTFLPGLTTNIEFGEWMKSGKVVLGYPPDAEHMLYITYKAQKYNIPLAFTLEDTIKILIKDIL